MYPITIQMAPTARKIVEQVLAIRREEHVLIITDTESPTTITQALASACGAVASETVLLIMATRTASGAEPPPMVASAMLGADVLLVQARYPIFHTNATRAALAKGARSCDMWGVSEEMMLRGGILADYEEVRSITRRLGELMRGARRARLTSPEGTDLQVTIEGRKVTELFGMALEPGKNCGLPDGETVISPLEGSAEGVLVNPCTIEKYEIAFPREPIRVEIKGGRVDRVSGGAEAVFLERLLEETGESSRNIAEFALGTNPYCRVGSNLREAKKSYGTAHVAIGDNKSLGGKVDSPLHLDMIFRDVTVTLDDLVVVKDGRVVA